MYIKNKKIESFISILILCSAVVIYVFLSSKIALNSNTWVDEIIYLIKSWKYINFLSTPYSSEDPTWYMPFYFLQIGIWQKIFGQDILISRLLSSIIGLINGLIVFKIIIKVTGSKISGSCGTLIFFTVPSVVFYFSTVTPTSTVSLILLVSIWVIIDSFRKADNYRSIILGVLFCLMFYYRQNMILAIIFLLPLYIYSIEEKKKQLFIILATISIFTFLLILLLPDKFIFSIFRLPLISPILSHLGFFNESSQLLDNYINSSLGLNLKNFALIDVIDAFILPYLGILICCLSVLILATKKPLILLSILPLFFLFLSFTHYIGSLSYCKTCILPYTSYYASIGAICGGISISLINSSSNLKSRFKIISICLFMIIIVSVNLFSSSLASRNEYKNYPISMLQNTRKTSWQEDVLQLSEFIKQNTDQDSEVLPIHNLSIVPYSIFLAKRDFPHQMININHTYREIDIKRYNEYDILNALEEEGFWSNQLLNKWIKEKFNIIIFQADPRDRYSELIDDIEKDFTRKASTGFRGWNIYIYERNIYSNKDQMNKQ